MNFPTPGSVRLARGVLLALFLVLAQFSAVDPAQAAPPAITKTEAEPAKTLYASISELVKGFFPRAKVTINGNTMHFEYKVQSQMNVQSHLMEMAPGIGGVLGDLEIKSGQYTGRESLPKRVNLITYESIVMAPYSPRYDSHYMAKLSFDPGTAPEFLEQFREILDQSASQVAESPKKTTPAPDKTDSTAAAAAKVAADAAATASTARATAPASAKASASPNSSADGSATTTATTAKTSSATDATARTTSSSPDAPTDAHASEALHDRDKTKDPWARNQVVILYYKKRVGEQTAAIGAKPKDPVGYSERADCYLHLNNPKQALEDADKAIAFCGKGHPIMRYAYCNRGEAKIQLKQYKEALEDLNKAIALEPESAEAIYFRGMVKEKSGDIEAAVKDYEMARTLGFAPYGVSVDYGPYMEILQRRIKKCWFPPKGNETKVVVLTFEVLRNGTFKNCKVYKTSGMPIADQAAIVAITNAAPFAPLPTGSKSPIPIEFRFDYNVFKASTQMVASGPSTSSIKSLEDEAQQQLTAAEGAKDELAQVAALISLGDCSRAQANFTGAEGFYNRALNLVKLKDDRKFEHSKVLGRFALMQSAQGKNQEADTQFKEAFKLAKEAGKNQLDPDVTEMLTEYAKFLYKSSRFDEANKIYTMLKQ